MRKKKIEVLNLTQDSVIAHMQNVLKMQEFEVLFGLWTIERERLLNEGKKTQKAEMWSELKGFDRAAQTIEVWASKRTRKEIEESEDELGDN